MNPVHAPTSHFLNIHLNIILQSCLLPSDFPIKTLYTPLPSHRCATCPARLILLDLITQTILGEEHRSLRSSLCSFLHSPVTSSLLGPNILLGALFSNAFSLCPSQCERPSFTPIQNNRQNYNSVYFNLCIFGQQTGRQKILHQIIASIP